MYDLPKSMKLFIGLSIAIVVLVPLGLIFGKTNTTENKNDTYLDVKYAENITKDDLEKLDSKETSPIVIQNIMRKSEQSFDTRDKESLLNDYVKNEISTDSLKKDRLILVSFDKTSKNVSEIREIITKLNPKKLNGELKLFYLNVPESNTEKARVQRVISEKFQQNDDINSLGIDYMVFDDITIIEKGEVVYQTKDYSELSNKKNKEIYK